MTDQIHNWQASFIVWNKKINIYTKFSPCKDLLPSALEAIETVLRINASEHERRCQVQFVGLIWSREPVVAQGMSLFSTAEPTQHGWRRTF